MLAGRPDTGPGSPLREVVVVCAVIDPREHVDAPWRSMDEEENVGCKMDATESMVEPRLDDPSNTNWVAAAQ